MIADAAKRGAVSYSVEGAYSRNNSGQLVKNVGAPDSHWVTHLKVNPDGSKTFHDSYDPFLETVEPNYDHQAAILYFLKRKDLSATPNFWDTVWTVLAGYWKHLGI